jgi:hypothetical protein
MEEKTIRAIPPMPFAVMIGAISAVIGLIVGILYAIVGAAIMSMLSSAGTGVDLGAIGILFGVGAIIVMPIVGFIGGLIEGLIIAVIYNFLAPRIGGIKLRFEEQSRGAPPPP